MYRVQKAKKMALFFLLPASLLTFSFSGCAGVDTQSTANTAVNTPAVTPQLTTVIPEETMNTTTPVPITTVTTTVPTPTVKTTTPPTPPTPIITQTWEEKTIAEAMDKFEALNSYTFDMDLDMYMDFREYAQSGNMVMNSFSTGGINLDAQEMQLSMVMTMTGETSELPVIIEDIDDITENITTISQNMSYELYLIKDWAYMKMEMPEADEGWIKFQIPNPDEAFNLDTVEQQTVMLDSPSEIVNVRSETVGGYDCHVFSVTPDKDAFIRYLQKQENLGITFDTADFNDMIKTFTYLCYISKDTNLLMRLNLDMLLEMNDENMGAPTKTNDRVTMSFYMDMTIHDHDEIFTVILPEEAADAEEVHEGSFSI